MFKINKFELLTVLFLGKATVFPEIKKFIEGDMKVKIDNEFITRNSNKGGSLLLRPIGQELIAQAYSKFSKNESKDFKEKLKKINFNLSHAYWKYVFWNDKMLGKELRLKKGIIFKLMGKPLPGYNLEKEMKRVYKLHNKDFNLKIESV